MIERAVNRRARWLHLGRRNLVVADQFSGDRRGGAPIQHGLPDLWLSGISR